MSDEGRIFISYRREGGAELARLIRDHLQRRGYDVFMDVEDLRSGPFNTALFQQIEQATDVVVLLTPTERRRGMVSHAFSIEDVRYVLPEGVDFTTAKLHDIRRGGKTGKDATAAVVDDQSSFSQVQIRLSEWNNKEVGPARAQGEF